MNTVGVLLGGSPGPWRSKVKLAFLRAIRTLLQGVAGAFPAAGAGTAILDATYWETFGYSCLAAGIAGLVSFIQNVANLFPDDPTQKIPE